MIFGEYAGFESEQLSNYCPADMTRVFLSGCVIAEKNACTQRESVSDDLSTDTTQVFFCALLQVEENRGMDIEILFDA